MNEVAQKKWIQTLHVAKSALHLDDDSYRAILRDAAAVESSTDLKTWQQYDAVLAAFKKLGFTPSASPLKRQQNQAERNPDWISAKQEYYIKGLWFLASRKRDEKSLRHMCKRITGSDDISFCRKCDATKLILALRKIAADAGYDPDNKPA